MLVASMFSAAVLAADEPLAAAQLIQRQQAGQAPVLLDVRHVDEYRDGHIAGALNIPVEQLAVRYTALGVPRDQEIVVRSPRGARAGNVAGTRL